MSQPDSRDLCTLADRINWLVATVHPTGRGPYSNYEIATLIEQVTGEKVSHNAIWKLRNGQAANPTMRLISALARVFGVAAGFFYGDESIPEDQIEILALVRNSGITSVQLRAFAELTPSAREAIAELIKETARAEAERPRRRRTKR